MVRSLASQRVALGIVYDGSRYHGWQYQGADVLTVQSTLQNALASIADHQLTLTCAGRTDTGVHATRQVVHFDVDNERPDKAWTEGTNARLPNDISVDWACRVSDDFSARFSATARRYHYVIHNSRIRSGLMSHLMARDHRTLDAAKMHEAAQLLLGEHDFTSYRAASCQARSPIRCVLHLNVRREGDLVILDILGTAFLHHMVRNIAGVLMDIGAGEKPVEWAGDLLAARNRNLGSVTASPAGLYLTDVIYPDQWDLPPGPRLPHLLSLLTTPGPGS